MLRKELKRKDFIIKDLLQTLIKEACNNND